MYDLPLLLFWTLSALLHSLYKRNLSRIPCKVIRNALGAPSSTLSPKAVGSSGSLNFSPDNQLGWGTTSGEPQQMFFNSLKFLIKIFHKESFYYSIFQCYSVSMRVKTLNTIIFSSVWNYIKKFKKGRFCLDLAATQVLSKRSQ